MMAWATLGCATIPEGQTATSAIDFRGNQELSDGELAGLLATRATPKFLGLVRGVFFEYRLFNRFTLQRDIQRVERIYRAHGYYHVRARAARVFHVRPNLVRVLIVIEEGKPTTIREIELEGLELVPDDERRRILSRMKQHVKTGEVFVEQDFEDARAEVLAQLRNFGYAHAEVDPQAHVSLPEHQADLRLTIRPDDKAVYGAIEIKNLPREFPEKKVRLALHLEPGERYSQAEVENAQQAVLALGVFSSVRVAPQRSEQTQKSDEVPILVEVEPSKVHTVDLGVGVGLDVLRTDLHGEASWKDQNFLGGLREFTIGVKPGVTFYPTRLQQLVPPTDLLPFFRVFSRLDQPGFIEARTKGFVRGAVEMYPLILSPHVDEDAPVLGYRQLEGAVGLERAFGRHVFVSPSYILQTSTPFAYRGQLDMDLRSLLISTVELFGRVDTRDDLIAPSRGFAVSTGVQYAGVGGDVEDLRLSPEVRGYIPLGKKWTLATRVGVGFLFPFNWGGTIGSTDGRPPEGARRADWVRDTQISAFRGFFAGGPNSNRGYGVRGIGPHGVIPFFVPDVQGQVAAARCEADPTADPATCLLPLGGKTLWEATLEVRFPLMKNLWGATFCDLADVAPQEVTFRFDRPHTSCGVGARYSTPVGPIRFDVGYRLPGLQTLDGDEGEGVPPELLGLPIAISLSIGEAF